MNGQKNWFQAPTKVNRNSIAAAGRAATTPTVQNVRSIDAPSTLAASMSSSGTVWLRYCVIQNTPKALVSAAMMIAPICPVQPRSENRMYSGTAPSWVGTARVATTKTSSPLLPRKRSFANAQPASVEKRTTDAAITVELKTEFHSAVQKLTAGLFTTVMALAMKLPPGIQDMFGSLRVDASPEPMRNDQ